MKSKIDNVQVEVNFIVGDRQELDLAEAILAEFCKNASIQSIVSGDNEHCDPTIEITINGEGGSTRMAFWSDDYALGIKNCLVEFIANNVTFIGLPNGEGFYLSINESAN